MNEKREASSHDYYVAIAEALTNSKKNFEQSIQNTNKKIAEKESGKKKKGFFEKIEISNDIVGDKNYIKKLEERKELISSIFSVLKDMNLLMQYKIDERSSKSLENAARYLFEDERDALRRLVSNCIKEERNKRTAKKNKCVEKAKSLREKADLSRSVIVKVDGDEKNTISMSMDIAFDRYGNKKMQTSESYYDKEWDPFVIVNSEGNRRERSESELKTKIDKAMSDPAFQKTHEYTVIKRNYDKIMKAVSDKENAMFEANNISADLKGLDGSVLGEVRDYLRSLSEQRKEDYRKANELLDKINLPKVEAVADQIIEKEREERLKAEKEESLKSKYGKAVEELERMKYNGGSANEIQALKRDIANMEMSDTDLFETKMNALGKVHEEQQEKEDKRHEDEDKKEKENRLKKALNDLNEEAEIRLAVKNRSLWKFNQDSKERQEEIRKIKGQIVQEAKLDPKERTLYQLKVDGAIRQEATLDNLTKEEASKFRWLYQRNIEIQREYHNSIKAYQDMTDGSLEEDISMHI